ncbi:unnamed protein product [Diamesa tonsa]
MRKFTVVFVTFTVIIVCVVILFHGNSVIINSKKLTKVVVNNFTDYNSICRTEACVIATAKLHSRLNLNVEPCDNFFDFACGTFVDETVIHERSKKYSTKTILVDEVMEKLRRLVTEKKLTTDIKPFVLVKEFYKKCSDRETIDNLEAIPLMQLMKNLGGWPILEQSWNEDEFQWNETSKLFISHGFIEDYLVEMSMSVDVRNNSKHILRIHQPLMNYSYNILYYTFLKEGLTNDKIKAYFEYMLELTRLLGATEDQSSIQMMEVLDFEIEMNKICAPLEDLRNQTKSYHYIRINELQRKYPYMNWLSFVKARVPKSIEIDDNEEVLYMGTDFLEKFGQLIEVIKYYLELKL